MGALKLLKLKLEWKLNGNIKKVIKISKEDKINKRKLKLKWKPKIQK